MTEPNHFLASLSRADRARLEPIMVRQTLIRDDAIANPGDRLTHAYLPVSSILSVITVMADGKMVESRTIGREGGYGLLHALGSRYAYERLEVQVAGEAWRVPLEALTALADESPAALKTIAAHAQATLVQAAVTVACNMMHSVGLRLARWLLVTQDRLGGADVIPLTQEHLSIMLGVQRTTVTAAIAELQAAGALTTLRGKITILDRRILEARVCECYQSLDKSIDGLLGTRVAEL